MSRNYLDKKLVYYFNNDVTIPRLQRETVIKIKGGVFNDYGEKYVCH